MSNSPLESLPPPDDLRLHYIGFVVHSIRVCAEFFVLALGATWDRNIVFDPVQKVRVTLLQAHNPSEPLMELVEPGGVESPVAQFAERGGGLHHVCYEVNDLDLQLRFCQSVGTQIIRPPIPAVAFGGRRIAWGITRRLLMEFLESKGI